MLIDWNSELCYRRRRIPSLLSLPCHTLFMTFWNRNSSAQRIAIALPRRKNRTIMNSCDFFITFLMFVPDELMINGNSFSFFSLCQLIVIIDFVVQLGSWEEGVVRWMKERQSSPIPTNRKLNILDMPSTNRLADPHQPCGNKNAQRNESIKNLLQMGNSSFLILLTNYNNLFKSLLMPSDEQIKSLLKWIHFTLTHTHTKAHKCTRTLLAASNSSTYHR